MDDAKLPFNTPLIFTHLITQYLEHFFNLVLRAGFKKKTWLYFELMICDKYRRKNTGPQCVKLLNCGPMASLGFLSFPSPKQPMTNWKLPSSQHHSHLLFQKHINKIMKLALSMKKTWGTGYSYLTDISDKTEAGRATVHMPCGSCHE
jgi:hypothetical protein